MGMRQLNVSLGAKVLQNLYASHSASDWPSFVQELEKDLCQHTFERGVENVASHAHAIIWLPTLC